MAITLSTETAASFKALATADNSATFETSALVVFAPVASVEGLEADIAAVIPNSNKAYAIAIITDEGAETYLEDTAEMSASVMQEIIDNMFEAKYC